MSNPGRKVYFTGKISHVDVGGNKRTANKGRSVYSFDLVNFPRIKADDYLFCRVRACTADVPNNNGDCFPYDELRKAYTSFIGKGVYIDHDTDSVDKIKGIILDAAFKERPEHGAWVELVLAVDRANTDLVRKIERGQITDVSMGCMVRKGTCSICGNQWIGEVDEQGYPVGSCDHVPFYKGVEWDGGKVVYENCEGVEFIEISFVTNGADPQALVLDNNIEPLVDIPETVAKLIEFPGNGNQRRVARSQRVFDSSTIVRALDEERSNKIFALCELVNSSKPWVEFQAIQNVGYAEAKKHLLNKIHRNAREIAAESFTYTIKESDRSLINTLVEDYINTNGYVDSPYAIESWVMAQLLDEKDTADISDPDGLVLKLSEKALKQKIANDKNKIIKIAADKKIKNISDLAVGDSIILSDSDYGYKDVNAKVYETISNYIAGDAVNVYIREGGLIGAYQVTQKDLDKGSTSITRINVD